MKRLFVLLSVVFIFAVTFTPALRAEEFTYPDGKVDLVCPDKWKHELADNTITMSSPDGAVSFVFELLDSDDLKKGLEEASKQINEALGATTFKDPTEEKVNGMDALTFEGECKAKGVNVVVSVINTPAEKALCLYYFAAKAAEETFAKEIAEIINGIKPAAAADAASGAGE